MPAQNQQEVINAWNNSCSTYSFSNVGSGTSGTMASVYSGSKFDDDCPALMSAMAAQLLSSVPANPRANDLVSAILNDPAWYT
jgi:hypothetical protein